MSESVGRYWCYECQQIINPMMELELKCPFCDSGFIEEMESRGDFESVPSMASNRSLSLWTPLWLDLMGGSSRRSRNRREEEEEDDSDLELEDFFRQHRRNSAILHLLRSLRDDLRSESGNFDGERERQRERRREREREREGDRESLILINPFNRAIILQGSSNDDEEESQDSSNNGAGISLGDYFLGPGLDVLLQHLAENDPNRYGTPPAKKEAVEALPTVKIEEAIGCSVCLDDFAIGTEAKEMPCKHKFHSDCILPWLELHSSCPVCRFQLPADESKIPNGSSSGSRVEGAAGGDAGSGRGDRNRFWVPVPWPFNGLFSLPRSENGENSSSNTSSSSSNSQNNQHDEAN